MQEAGCSAQAGVRSCELRGVAGKGAPPTQSQTRSALPIDQNPLCRKLRTAAWLQNKQRTCMFIPSGPPGLGVLPGPMSSRSGKYTRFL